MKLGLLITLCIGVGWIIGITVMMIFLPASGALNYTLDEVVGTIFVAGFPGFVMFMIALILAIMDDADESPFQV